MNIKKTVALMLALVTLLSMSVIFVSADGDTQPRVVDYAELLTETEVASLLAKYDAYSEELKFDIVLVIVDDIRDFIDTNDQPYTNYAAFGDDYFDYFGFGYGNDYSGALLVYELDADYRYVSTCGEGIDTVSVDVVKEDILGYFEDGQYAKAFNGFAESCKKQVEYYRENGKPYVNFPWSTYIVIALVIGLIVALIVTGKMKAKLKTVQFAKEANQYIRPGTLNITDSRDIYLYNTVTRIRRERQSSSGGGSHTSSSGRSHGGGGF